MKSHLSINHTAYFDGGHEYIDETVEMLIRIESCELISKAASETSYLIIFKEFKHGSPLPCLVFQDESERDTMFQEIKTKLV
jgi:hypothetical protein